MASGTCTQSQQYQRMVFVLIYSGCLRKFGEQSVTEQTRNYFRVLKLKTVIMRLKNILLFLQSLPIKSAQSQAQMIANTSESRPTTASMCTLTPRIKRTRATFERAAVAARMPLEGKMSRYQADIQLSAFTASASATRTR